ncbi:MAG: glycosyltransferase family 2 protein [Clostridiales bacterium]|nr:glycosyltransferase family 2 protein [Clostridiales bacterium]
MQVSIIIAAYNEESIIDAKIQNTLSLDYPLDKLEIIAASDASTDRTDEILRSYVQQGVIFKRIEGRKGKTELQNQCVEIARGEIIVFSDANAMYDKNALKKIVRNFHDEQVGGVCGNLVYLQQNQDNTENAYWSFEKFLKKRESSIGSVLGANGSIYAIRKALYVPLPAEMISDFVEPLKVVELGYRVVYEDEAISREPIESVDVGIQAFRRKVRISARSLLAILNMLNLLNFSKYGFFSLQWFSHKVLRYIMPFIMVIVFLLSIVLVHTTLYCWIFLLQCLFYLSALFGYMLGNSSFQVKLFSFAWYFLWTHFAIIVAWFKVLEGEKTVVWETKR